MAWSWSLTTGCPLASHGGSVVTYGAKAPRPPARADAAPRLPASAAAPSRRPRFYPIYFAILLIHRAFRDDHFCRTKYGGHGGGAPAY
eukprot:gene2261-22009_t